MKRTQSEVPLTKGFAELLASTDRATKQWQLDKDTRHLPGDLEHGLIYYRDLLKKHHKAMLGRKWETVGELRRDAHLLALKLNHGEVAIFKDETAVGHVLQNTTAAAAETVPLLGQLGSFTLTIDKMRVRIVCADGLIDLRHGVSWPGFEAHAVDQDKPFLSNTGYRSFMLVSSIPDKGALPFDKYVALRLKRYIAQDLKGRLVAIAPKPKGK